MYMGSFIFIALTAFIFILLILNIKIVEQNTVLVIEFLGKYSRLMTAGFNIKIPFLERVADTVSLRQQNFAIEGRYPSADKVIVDIATNLIYAVDNSEEGVKKYTYALENRSQSIAAIIENSLRTYVAKETHEGILEKKEELAVHIQNDLEKAFGEWGMFIKSFQITNVNFPQTITNAMSEVVASLQLRKAAENKGEAIKIQAIKEAEAEKERKRLQGEGVAQEREAIAKGLENSIATLQQITNQNPKEIMAILSLTQYLDTLKSVGQTPNSKVIFMDTSVGKTSELMKDLIASQEIK
jgi:regulator of protease activity HflC (stomatin/prohibitin superfamily)